MLEILELFIVGLILSSPLLICLIVSTITEKKYDKEIEIFEKTFKQ